MTDTAKFDINGVIQSAQAVIVKPAEFYKSMNRTGGYLNPLIFVVMMAVVAGLLSTVVSGLGMGSMGTMGAGISIVFVLPIMVLIGSFIVAAIMFVIWKLMGSEQSYETAYRCVAFAAAILPITTVLSLVPYVGTVLGTVWGFWLMIVASEHVHGIDRKKATIVLGVLGAVVVLMNIQGERTRRQMQERFEQFNSQMGELQNMTPEEAGKAVGEFMKGLEQETSQD